MNLFCNRQRFVIGRHSFVRFQCCQRFANKVCHKTSVSVEAHLLELWGEEEVAAGHEQLLLLYGEYAAFSKSHNVGRHPTRAVLVSLGILY